MTNRTEISQILADAMVADGGVYEGPFVTDDGSDWSYYCYYFDGITVAIGWDYDTAAWLCITERAYWWADRAFVGDIQYIINTSMGCTPGTLYPPEAESVEPVDETVDLFGRIGWYTAPDSDTYNYDEGIDWYDEYQYHQLSFENHLAALAGGWS